MGIFTAKLGSRKQPVVVRVQTHKKAEEIFTFCTENDWHVIIGIEPDMQEDISDVYRLTHPPEPYLAHFKPGRNEPCFCGSGKKYKKCCLID